MEKKDTLFIADEEGFITESPKGDNLHGWMELLCVYGYSSFPGKCLAELSDTEWEQYLEDIKDIDPFALLQDYLSKESTS